MQHHHVAVCRTVDGGLHPGEMSLEMLVKCEKKAATSLHTRDILQRLFDFFVHMSSDQAPGLPVTNIASRSVLECYRGRARLPSWVRLPMRATATGTLRIGGVCFWRQSERPGVHAVFHNEQTPSAGAARAGLHPAHPRGRKPSQVHSIPRAHAAATIRGDWHRAPRRHLHTGARQAHATRTRGVLHECARTLW